jgi:uncharacterized membrane protein (Fun14 family)
MGAQCVLVLRSSSLLIKKRQGQKGDEKGMVVENILTGIPTPIITFGGSTLCGYFIGALVKRVLKIVVIIVGAFLGTVFIAIQYMAHKGYLGAQSQIDWTRIGADTAAWFQSVAAHFSNQHIFSVLGIPATSGLAMGVVAGLIKS